MKHARGCIPCLVRQSLDSARRVSTDAALHERVRREVVRWIGEMDLDRPGPAVGQLVHRRLRLFLGSGDPCREVKAEQNRMALALLPELRERLQKAADPLKAALSMALAGNMIDVKAARRINRSEVRQAVFEALEVPFCGDYNRFRQEAARARQVLYLTDNAGEIALDRLLIEQLRPARVTVAVRGAPVINDATLADARAVGLDAVAEVIDNGSDAPGTLLADCGRMFRERFAAADLILAKGQGNFETLSGRPENLCFLFKVKCAVVAGHARVPVGTHVLAGSPPATASGAADRD